MADQSTPAYKVQPIPGKGLGVFATRSIPCGTLIISERPLLTLPGRFTLAGLFTNIESKVQSLPKDKQQIFFSLHNSYPKDYPGARGIIKTNAQPLGAGSVECGIFPVCSCFNHSCVANANYAYNPNVAEERIHAIKDIASGDEITVSYLTLSQLTLTRSYRQELLTRDFRFECQCSLCRASPEVVAHSDWRRAEIGMLNTAIDSDTIGIMDPARCLGYCKRVVELYKEEKASGFSLYSTYLDAVDVCLMNGDMARGSAFAAMAVKLKKTYQGEDAPDLDEIELLAAYPELHPGVGSSRLWATDKGSALALGADGFEEWLWSRVV